MSRRCRKTWRYLSTWLLLLSTVCLDLHLYMPQVWAQKERAKIVADEAEPGVESLVVPAFQCRAESRAPHRLDWVILEPSESAPRSLVHGQVCVADGLQGSRSHLHGCGAELLL